MKIYIDGLFYKGSGIGRYYESLMKEFSKQDIKIYTCVPKRLKKDFEKDFEGYLQSIIPIFVDYEKFSYKNFIRSRKILKKLENKVDLFFYPHINLPLYIPHNTITTIHDLRQSAKGFLYKLEHTIEQRIASNAGIILIGVGVIMFLSCWEYRCCRFVLRPFSRLWQKP
jgi:hypothetical protein